MRRRFTLVIVGVVTLALLLSGVGTLLLVRHAARHETRAHLVAQARDLATQAADPATFRALAGASRALRLEGLNRVTFGAAGVLDGSLPAGITVEDIQPRALRQGIAVSGFKGSLAYAAVGVERPARPGRLAGRRAAPPAPFLAVVLTRQADPGLQRGGWWFLLSSVVALAAAALVADRLGRRITAPLAAAEGATRRIAAGDLEARVPEPATDAELASLAASINSMAESLGRSRRLERQFLLAVSHDLRTPLTSIRGFAEAIADGAAPDHGRAAEVIAAESRRLERLVADLLELAKLDARRFSLDLRRVDVAEVVAVTAAGFLPEAVELGLELGVELPPAPLLATADPDRLAQVVANLVENALKYASGRIAVGASAGPDAAVVVVVDDDGPGIANEDLPSVFERLYTPPRPVPGAPGPSGRSGLAAAGSGLGLAIVAELVSAMGGTVAARSLGAGGGTRMEVCLRPWSEVSGSSSSA